MYITTSSSVPRVLLVWFFLLYSLGWTAPLAGPAELEISGPDQLNEALSRYSGIRNLPAPGEDDKSDSFLSVRADLPVVPGVNECFSKIQAWGVADNLPDVFFTAYPVNKNVAFHWGLDYFDEDLGATKANWKFAFWDRLADPSYMSDTANNLRTAMQNAGFSKKRRKYYQDRFLKNFSQAFAESAHGDVIVLLKQNVAPDNNWDSSTTWGGWEYPALTRNSNVDNIYRVDPYDECNTMTKVWSKGDSPSQQKPKGKKDSTKPYKYGII